LRRCLLVRWKTVVKDQSDATARSSDEDREEERGAFRSTTVDKSEKWYSKKEYKQMLMDQCLTVHIMRSLRSLEGETVTTDHSDEDDCNNSRFDELIKKHLIDPEEYCERGLESHLSEERRNDINAARKPHKSLVIREHVRQKMMGIQNPELLRSVSLTQSRKSSIRVQKLALVDQREARARNNTKNTNDENQKQDRRRHQQQIQHTSTNVERNMTPLDLLWSRSGHENKKMTDPLSFRTQGVKIMGKGINKMLCNHLEHNLFEQTHQNKNSDVSEAIAIRDNFMKQQQQQLHLLLKQNQRSQSEYHLKHTNLSSMLIPDGSSTATNPPNMNSILASLQMQEHERLFQHSQQQLQNQRNYQQQVQRLLLLQQHEQHYKSLQLASAVILGQSHR